MKKRILASLLMSFLLASLALFTTEFSQNIGVSGAAAPEDAPALWNAGDTRNKIVVISDIHLGIYDNYTETLQTARCWLFCGVWSTTMSENW